MFFAAPGGDLRVTAKDVLPRDVKTLDDLHAEMERLLDAR